MSYTENYTAERLTVMSKIFSLFFFSLSLSEQLEVESVLGVSIWLKLSEIISSPPLHLTIPHSPHPSLLPPTFTSPLYWLALLHHTGDPVERIFSLYKEKMQLKRLWDDRKDLLRISLPLTPARASSAASTPTHLECCSTLKHTYRLLFTYWTEVDIWMTRDFPVCSAIVQEWTKTPNVNLLFLLRWELFSWDFVRRRFQAQFVLQVRGEGAWGQMAALTIQRTDNFLHTFLQVCCIILFVNAANADLHISCFSAGETSPQLVCND